MYSKKPCKASELEILFLSISVNSGNSLRLDYSRRVLAQLCALRTHDVRALFSLERLSSAALFQETMVCSLGKKKKKILPKMRSPLFCTRISAECSTPASGTAQDTHIDVKHPGRSITFPWNQSFPCTATVFAFYFLFCFSLEDECR